MEQNTKNNLISSVTGLVGGFGVAATCSSASPASFVVSVVCSFGAVAVSSAIGHHYGASEHKKLPFMAAMLASYLVASPFLKSLEAGQPRTGIALTQEFQVANCKNSSSFDLKTNTFVVRTTKVNNNLKL